MCVPIVDDKIPSLKFNSFIARYEIFQIASLMRRTNFCYHSVYPEHHGLDTQQESCLADAVPSTFAAISSDNCDSSIPPYLISSFPTVFTEQNSAYNFDCSNAEALGIITLA
jgi:hypothetical protein